MTIIKNLNQQANKAEGIGGVQTKSIYPYYVCTGSEVAGDYLALGRINSKAELKSLAVTADLTGQTATNFVLLDEDGNEATNPLKTSVSLVSATNAQILAKGQTQQTLKEIGGDDYDGVYTVAVKLSAGGAAATSMYAILIYIDNI
jgi:hypothetical protein